MKHWNNIFLRSLSLLSISPSSTSLKPLASKQVSSILAYPKITRTTVKHDVDVFPFLLKKFQCLIITEETKNKLFSPAFKSLNIWFWFCKILISLSYKPQSDQTQLLALLCGHNLSNLASIFCSCCFFPPAPPPWISTSNIIQGPACQRSHLSLGSSFIYFYVLCISSLWTVSFLREGTCLTPLFATMVVPWP